MNNVGVGGPIPLVLPSPTKWLAGRMHRVRDVLRVLIITAGTLGFVLTVSQIAVDAVAPLGSLAVFVAASELFAVRRAPSPGVFTITFVGLATTVLLGNLPAALLLGLFSVFLGDGILRKASWLTVWERASLLTLMLLAGAALLAIGRLPEKDPLHWALRGILLLWVLVFVVWFWAQRRGTAEGLAHRLGAGGALFFLLTMLAAPWWRGLIERGPWAPGISGAEPGLLLAAGFMSVDLVVASALACCAQGKAGLRFWRGALVPTFYSYNAQALLGALLVALAAWGSVPGLLLGETIGLLGLGVYGLRVNQEKLFQSTICAITSALDARDHYTQGHSDRVASYAVAVGTDLGWSRGRLRTLELAARLHDLGKIGIPDAILLKPGRYTPEEYEVMKTHVAKGVDILWNVPELREAAQIVEQEHERYDGSGYPKGLVGEMQRIEARIIAVADVYDAMTSDRPYRAALATEEVLSYLHESAGKTLDPDIVAIFVTTYRQGNLEAALQFAYCPTH